MQIYPHPSSPPPSAKTDSPRPVPGLSICRTSDRSYAPFSLVTNCSFPNKLQGSLPLWAARMKLCDWFGTVITILAGCLRPFACGSLPPPLFFPSLLVFSGCMVCTRCICVCVISDGWLEAYYFKLSPAPALIPVFFREG